jgi:hypothetical protein
VGLASGEHLDSALPNAIDLSQSTSGGNAGTSGEAAEPGRALGNGRLGNNNLSLLDNNGFLGLLLLGLLNDNLLRSGGGRGGGLNLDLLLLLLLLDFNLAGNLGRDLGLINDLLDLLGLLEGLVGLDLVRPGI